MKLLSVTQVAERDSIEPRSVLYRIKRGLYPGAFKLGRAWRIPEYELTRGWYRHPFTHYPTEMLLRMSQKED